MEIRTEPLHSGVEAAVLAARHLSRKPGTKSRPDGKVVWTPTTALCEYVQLQYKTKQNETITLLQGREADNTIIHYEQIKRCGPVLVPLDTKSQATRQVVDYMVDIPRVIPAEWVQKVIVGT